MSSIKQLALLGGIPAFQEPLHVGRPNIGDRGQFMRLAGQIFDSRWLTNHGPLVKQFEQEISEKLGVKHCLAICNATIALEIAIHALGLKGEVITPSFTFIATAHALQWLGIQPVFCDIDPLTHNLDPVCVEHLISPHTTGILGVHLWGRPCAVDRLQEIARRNHLKLLFDAAHAFGCTYQTKRIGGFGDAEVFSFHATKFFNTFEGGAITTNEDELADRICKMRNFGFAGYDDVVQVGTNGKMSEIAAAMGLVNLKSLDEFTAVNHHNYLKYQQELKTVPGLSLLQFDESETCNFQYIVVEVDQQVTGLSCDALVETLWAENVRARRYFWPGCHRMEPYRTLFPDAHLSLPQTERVAGRVIVLPTGTTIGDDEIETICTILRAAIAKAPEIRQRVTV